MPAAITHLGNGSTTLTVGAAATVIGETGGPGGVVDIGTDRIIAVRFDLSALAWGVAGGDFFLVEFMTKVRSGDTLRRSRAAPFAGVQSDPNPTSEPLIVGPYGQVKISLPTGGANRAIIWDIMQL